MSDGRGEAIRADNIESGGKHECGSVRAGVSGDLVDVVPRIAESNFVHGVKSASVGEASIALSERLQLHIPFLVFGSLAKHHVSGSDVRRRCLDISRERHLGHQQGEAEEAGEASDGADELD